LKVIDRIRRKLVDYGFFTIGTGKLCIATYHGIATVTKNKFNGRYFSVSDLESHLKYFKRNFHSVSLEDIHNGNFRKDKMNIHITFDDGYLNNYKYAFPLLEKYQLHSTLYITGIHRTDNKILWADLLDISPYYMKDILNVDGVTYYKKDQSFSELAKAIKTDVIGGFEYKSKVEKAIFNNLRQDFRRDSSLDDYWKLMDDNDIIHVSKSKYVGIGSHGYYHNNLGVLPLHLAINEIKDSKALLESLIQKSVSSIAYPDGSYNNDLLLETRKHGFNIQFLYGAIDSYFLKIPGVYDREGLYAKASSENEIFYKLINGKTNRRV
jgi:peptidoglycan/xylan/chitin deacetylase (PgdA/CDA1 family)